MLATKGMMVALLNKHFHQRQVSSIAILDVIGVLNGLPVQMNVCFNAHFNWWLAISAEQIIEKDINQALMKI